MRKIIIWSVLGTLCISSIRCLKSSTLTPCTNRTVSQDELGILTYLAANNITNYVKHSSGLYYKIDSVGGGATANSSSKVYVKYTGKFTDNTVFDTVTDPSKTGFVLGTLIQGWQIGIPLIQKGGKIELFIPSALAYGCQQVGPVPPNSILVFTVELVDVI